MPFFCRIHSFIPIDMQKRSLPLLFLGLFFMLIHAHGQKQKWRWQNPIPQGNHIRGSDAIDPSTIVMVGDAGTILKTKDGGKNWERLETNSRADLYAVSFWNEFIGMAVGEDGTILKTTDCGQSWKKLNSGRNDTLRGISFLTQQKIIAVGDTGTIIRTNDGGDSWVYTPFPNFRSNLNDITFPAPDFGVIVGDSFPPFGGPPIIFSEDSGGSWTPWGGGSTALTGINLNSVWMPEKAPDKAVMVGDKGLIVSTTTKGQALSTPVSPVTVDISDVWFFNDDNGFATGPNGTILRTTDCGDTWSLIIPPSPLNREIITIIYPDSANGYFGGSNGLLFGTNDLCNTFNQFQRAYFPNLTDVTFIDDSFGIATGRQGIVLRTQNGGNDWIPPIGLDFFTLDDLESSTTTRLPDQRSTVWVAGGTFGDSAEVFCTQDTFRSWKKQRVPSPFKFFDITFYDSLKGFAVGYNGAIYCTQNGGKTWGKKNGNTINWLLSVAMPSDSCAYVVGGFGSILRTRDFGNRWEPLSSGTQEWLTSVSFLDDSFGIATGNHGVVLRTKNGGDQWEDVSISSRLDVDFTSSYMYRHDVGAYKNGEKGVSLMVVAFDGSIFFSPDFGDSWVEQDSKTRFPLQGCFFLDSLKGWAVGDFGTILHTESHFPPSVSIDKELTHPAVASMGLCYPNPAYMSTTIPFELRQAAEVQLALYDWHGRLIETLVQEKMPPGKYTKQVEVEGLSEGFYIYRLQVGTEVFANRMIVLNR